jgi:uncharacterized protein YneF (UPF0154 family)
LNKKKSTGPLPKLLGFIIVLFIGILVGTYVASRNINPVILDEHGNVRQ